MSNRSKKSKYHLNDANRLMKSYYSSACTILVNWRMIGLNSRPMRIQRKTRVLVAHACIRNNWQPPTLSSSCSFFSLNWTERQRTRCRSRRRQDRMAFEGIIVDVRVRTRPKRIKRSNRFCSSSWSKRPCNVHDIWMSAESFNKSHRLTLLSWSSSSSKLWFIVLFTDKYDIVRRTTRNSFFPLYHAAMFTKPNQYSPDDEFV